MGKVEGISNNCPYKADDMHMAIKSGDQITSGTRIEMFVVGDVTVVLMTSLLSY